MSSIDLALTNLSHPAILAFVLGVVTAIARSDLRIPEGAAKLLSSYLLLAIGLKGGVALVTATPGELVRPLLVTLAVGASMPVVSYQVLRRWGRFSVADSASIAAHYGSVSVVTFVAAVAFTEAAGQAAESFMPALVAVLEVPGILIALAIAKRSRPGGSLKHGIREVLTGSSMVLLLGGVAIGAVAGPSGKALVAPFFVEPFAGVLVLFLLHLGTVVGRRLPDVRKAGTFLIGFAVVTPLVAGVAGASLGTWAGLSVGGAAVFGAMAASASYIAAPAAVGVSLPDANLAHALTAALATTFPLNLALGIPVYHAVAQALS